MGKLDLLRRARYETRYVEKIISHTSRQVKAYCCRMKCVYTGAVVTPSSVVGTTDAKCHCFCLILHFFSFTFQQFVPVQYRHSLWSRNSLGSSKERPYINEYT